MATMQSLTLWVACPKSTPIHRSIQYCLTCECFAGSIADEVFCIWEEK